MTKGLFAALTELPADGSNRQLSILTVRRLREAACADQNHHAYWRNRPQRAHGYTSLSRWLALPSNETRGPDPETLAPRATWRNSLQLPVRSAMRQVQGIGDAGHRLEADEVALGGR
jgi:hypothetical protein